MNKDRKDIEKNILSDYTEDIFSQRENDEFHISVRYEQELMDAVKMGDIERLKTISLEKYSGNAGRLSDDLIKNFRYFAICCITLFTRAAMDGVEVIGYTPWGCIDCISFTTGEMGKGYGFIYVDKDNEGRGTLKRSKKESFYWYKKVIHSNGEDL